MCFLFGLYFLLHLDLINADFDFLLFQLRSLLVLLVKHFLIDRIIMLMQLTFMFFCLTFMRLLLIELVVLYNNPVVLIDHHLFCLICLHLSLRLLDDQFFLPHRKLQPLMNRTLLTFIFAHFILYPLLQRLRTDRVDLSRMPAPTPTIFLSQHLSLHLSPLSFMHRYSLAVERCEVYFIELAIGYAPECDPFLAYEAPFPISFLPQTLIRADHMNKPNLGPLHFIDEEAIVDPHNKRGILTLIGAGTHPLQLAPHILFKHLPCLRNANLGLTVEPNFIEVELLQQPNIIIYLHRQFYFCSVRSTHQYQLYFLSELFDAHESNSEL